MPFNNTYSQHYERVSAPTNDSNNENTIRKPIASSWERCITEYGLDPLKNNEPMIVERSVLRERQECLSMLITIAKVEMANLYQLVPGSGHSTLLTDEAGMIIQYIGNQYFNSKATKQYLQVGSVWSEQYQGTNGMAICIVEQKPMIVDKEEHFFVNNRNISCTASPIFNPQGEILGILDLSSESILNQAHTMVLVNMYAKTIENRLFHGMFEKQNIIRFHNRCEFINTIGEGLIAFKSDGTIMAANKTALLLLDIKSTNDICQYNIDNLFDCQLHQLLRSPLRSSQHTISIHESKNSQHFFAALQLASNEQFRTVFVPGADNRNKSLAEEPATLPKLEFGDHHMVQNINIAQRVLDRKIPIMLLGESGTGKGVFAKAIHMSSKHADKPFVAINCASIPESLIESELFGYKAGAFTGASNRGSMGKIVQSDGGTLFLDEIGDMPLSLQARLLRVLEEKEVVPLGGHTPVSVDINIISATHRNIKEMMINSDFRADLYYRLQGVNITLPPLRERTDKRNLVKYLFQMETSDIQPVQIGDGVIDQFCSYYWPGNIRQLRNVLRTMLALAQTNHITTADMIDELFLEAHSTTNTLAPVSQIETENCDPLLNAERSALQQELESYNWNITVVSKHLGLSRNTLYRKIKRCGITLPRK